MKCGTVKRSVNFGTRDMLPPVGLLTHCNSFNFTLIKVDELLGSFTQSLHVHQVTVDVRVVQSTEGHVYTHRQRIHTLMIQYMRPAVLHGCYFIHNCSNSQHQNQKAHQKTGLESEKQWNHCSQLWS